MAKDILIGILLFFTGFGSGYYFGEHHSVNNTIGAESSTQQNSVANMSGGGFKANNDTNFGNSVENAGNGEVPNKAMEVLDYINKNHQAMDGYVGGRVFKNFEHQLPNTNAAGTTINYQEWDVNAKQQGQNRGTERLVTGDDGSAYYTNDHYKSFKKIK